MELLQEVYFGRAPVAPLQKQLSKFRHKLKNKQVTSATNFDPEIVKFNRLAEKIFGFKTFSLYIQPNNMPNAYAFSVDALLTDDEKKAVYASLSASSTGFKYNNAFANVSLVCAINSSLINADWATDEELMAVILHETGHGFFEAVTSKDTEYSTSRKLTTILLSINKFALEKVKEGKLVSTKIVDNELGRLRNLISGVKKSLFGIRSRLFESMDDNLKKNRIGYTNEKFADVFAASYGYGDAHHSIQIKMFDHIYRDAFGVRKYNKLQEIIKMYRLYINDLLEYTFNMQDEHPAQLGRIKTSVDYIKKELSKEGLDPKLKRELMEELDRLNLLIKEFIEYPKDDDSMRILRLYYIKLYEKFGGDRREQDTDNDALFDAIDSKYNNLMGYN